ncbi:MAG: biopolymer transporter ExbD [Caulobacteraceae bacterium]
MAAKLAGGGKARYELGQNADINVTPFVDVMLVLLIIFMVAAPLATTSIRIDLPPATDAGKNQKKPTFLSVHRGGAVDVIGQESTRKVPDLSQLSSLMAPMLGGVGSPQDKTVLIRADRDVRYKEFMAVVNQLYRDGYYKVGLISEELG